MKRLFLIASIVLMFVFLLSIPTLASEIEDIPAYDRTYNVDGVEYPIWEQDANGNYHPLIWYLNNENEMCKVWADNQDSTKAPYVTYACYMTGASDSEIGTIRIYDENGTEYLTRERAVIANFNSVQITYNGQTAYICRINQNAFNKSSLIKAAFLPKTINFMGPSSGDQYKFSTFRECANLEYVEFPENADITSIGNAAFYKCYALKAISLPKNITTIEPVAFQHCTSLQAVYLPDGFQKMMCNDATSGSFHNCTSMYFVDEPFVLNSRLTNMPEKKSVYYFPSTLTGLGEGIRNCANMNETLVIPNYTSHTTSTYEGTGVKTVVYLGEMTYFWMTATQSTKLNVVFANTTSIPEIEVTGDHSAGSTIYLCKLGKSYNLNNKVWVDETTHFEEPSKSVVVKEPTCVDNARKDTTCFCGEYIGEAEIENSNYGGEHDLANATVINIVYTDFARTGDKILKCPKCNAKDITEDAPALFTCNGYSAPENGAGGIAIDYVVNTEAMAEYERVTNVAISYGIYAATQNNLGDGYIFDENGTVADGALTAALNKQYTKIQIKLVGFNTDELKAAKFAIGAYVETVSSEDKEISYLQHGEILDGMKYAFVSFNDIVKDISDEE